MATNLDDLIKAELGQQTTLEGDISKGASAQAALAQVKAILADLSAAQQRRTSLLDGATKRLAAAQATAAQVTVGLAAIDAMFTSLPGTLKVADLEAYVVAKLAAPLDVTKKYDDYAAAYVSASAAEVAATTKATQARDDEAQARASVDRAEAALQAAVDVAATAAEAAKATLADALRAKSAGDFAGAYWLERRAKALVVTATDPAIGTAVTAASDALVKAINTAADATDLRLKAEAAVAKRQEERSAASELLGVAAAQVQKRLSDAIVKAKAGP